MKCYTIFVSGRPSVGLAFELFRFTTEFGMGSLLNPKQQKTRHITVTGFFNLKPGNVVVPTAVESHSEMLHYHCVGAAFRGARLRAVWFTT